MAKDKGKFPEYPKRSMKERFFFHLGRVKDAREHGELGKMSDKEKAAYSLGYLKRAGQEADIYNKKSGKPTYRERVKADKKGEPSVALPAVYSVKPADEAQTVYEAFYPRDLN